jgi:hypothetical protein
MPGAISRAGASLACLLFLFACALQNGYPNQPIAAPQKSTTPAIIATQLPTTAYTPIHLGPQFPRLGMWWPNGWDQPLTEIARYDWVILGDWQAQFIDPLRKLNPGIVLLTSTDACELHYDATDPSANQALLKIPYQWFLTQVGSTLSTDVDASQTQLPVAAVSLASGKSVLDLFAPGDTALIENESVVIQKVDATRRMLTVQRGFIRPASAHKAGARIAAHVSTWPNTWMLNVSTLSPQAVADPQAGEETWPAYNARIGKGLMSDARWSGILVDRSDTDESRYIDGSSIRSLDPDQSNRLLTDYSAFDAAWNDGMRLYLHDLRQSLGPDALILLNWGIVDYQDANGNNFEGFPDDAGGLGDNPWSSLVFGPTPHGSYSDWVSRALAPTLTMIETYEDNQVPAGNYDNRCAQPGFTPNYRKMRFGLTTALLDDGYFSYEMNTAGHGSLCLMWFDEYDNAGKGRGYLGYPLTAAAMVAQQPDVWERSYQNGLVLVNAGENPATISLGQAYRKIKGTQDPAVNDGSLVTQVILPPKDGLILLKP